MSQDFYKQHSVITDPGNHAELFDTIPDDIAGVCQTVQGLYTHYAAPYYQPPIDRLCEVDTRYVKDMLQRILELDERPLTDSRPFEKRLVGCCRDATLLAVSMLRHKGIPARARYGTSAYFEADYYIDHVIVEYWNGTRWVAVDSELGKEAVEYLGISFDVHDIPDDKFVRGGTGLAHVP